MEEAGHRNRSAGIMTAGCFAFLLFMMAYQINHSSLWYDEWIEYFYSQAGILNGELYMRVVSTFQPPFYNVLMHFWLMINHSLGWFRLFNLIPGMIAGVALYRTVRRLSDERLAAISVLLLAGCYQWIYMIQECSEYVLMLMFVFLTLDAYTLAEKEPSLRHTILLALMSAGAAYSQYGCVFVVGPLLILHLIRTFQRHSRQEINHVLMVYAASLAGLAIPLYVFFARVQLANNALSGSGPVGEALSLPDFVERAGGIFFYIMMRQEISGTAAFASGVLLLGFSVVTVLRHRHDAEGDIALTYLLAAVLHYVLVKKHIYAMVLVGLSAGFYCRYSVFYLCLYPLLIVIFAREFSALLKREQVSPVLACTVLVLTGLVSVPRILRNWEKSSDAVLAWTWLERKGYETTTYLYGTSENAFRYFVTDEGYDTSQVVNRCWVHIDLNTVPDQFWVWYSDYGMDESISFADDHNSLKEDLKKMGFQEDIAEEGPYGELAYYHRP